MRFCTLVRTTRPASIATVLFLSLGGCEPGPGIPDDPVDPRIGQSEEASGVELESGTARQPATAGQDGQDPSTITLQQLSENMNEYLNRSVQTTGRVAEVIYDRAFTFEADRTIGTTDIFVIDPQMQAGQQLTPGQLVQVEGTVRRLSANELQEIYGVDVTEEVIFNWVGRNVIIAQQVEPYQDQSH